MCLSNAVRVLVVTGAMLAVTAVLPAPATAQLSIGISVDFAPPEFPVYEQPICPGEGYIWTPGFWAWDSDDEESYAAAQTLRHLDSIFILRCGPWGP